MKLLRLFVVAAVLSVIGTLLAKTMTDDPSAETAIGAVLAGLQAVFAEAVIFVGSLFAGGGFIVTLMAALLVVFIFGAIIAAIGAVFVALGRALSGDF